jgi:hypothetical protein
MQLKKMDSRAEILKLTKAERLRWFNLRLIDHREALRIRDELTHLLNPENPVRIILLIGATGIGKTKMLLSTLFSILKERWKDVSETDVPYIFVDAPSTGGRSFSWAALWREVLRTGHDVLIDSKINVSIDPNGPGRKSLVYVLRASVISMLKQRCVRVLAFDEVAHIFRHEGNDAVMDTIKSLADATPAKLILAGSFNVVPMVARYGQIQRRLAVLHYSRYKLGDEEDEKEFSNCVKKFQDLWPCREIPDFEKISPRLMAASLGSVGILKDLLTSFLQQQLKARGERFSVDFLKTSALSRKQLTDIENEVKSGEDELNDLVYGQTDFDDLTSFGRVRGTA